MSNYQEVFQLELNQNPSLQTLYQKENELFDQFAQESLLAFKDAGQLFNTDNDEKIAADQKRKKQVYDKSMVQIQNLFNTYCILKKKYSQQKEIKSNVVIEQQHNYNMRKRMFGILKNYWEYQDYLRKKQEYSTAFLQRNLLRRVVKGWFTQVQSENRLAIKNQCLKRTDNEISKIQKEYEQIIAELDLNLKRKMEELKKEEEEHKILLEKYENMVVDKKKSQLQ